MAKGNIPVDLFCASYLCNCTYELNSSTLKRVTKPDIPWGLFLIGLSLLGDPEVEPQGLIQDLDLALLGLSLLGIAIVARKIPQATFFLFQMTWELVFLVNEAICQGQSSRTA